MKNAGIETWSLSFLHPQPQATAHWMHDFQTLRQQELASYLALITV